MLAYLKLQAVIGDANEFVELLALAATMVTPTKTIELARDPNDDRLIEAALAGEADAIMPGDQHVLTLRRVGQIRIMTHRDFRDFKLSGS